jgi:putative DNA primase/helicase
LQRSNIPEELRSLPQWVNWRLEDRGDKLTKIPYQPSGVKASSTDRKTWNTYWTVTQASKNVGFVFTKETGYVGVDFDKCRDKSTGETEQWAIDIINELDSYTELSQSETGWHVIVKGLLPLTGRHPKDSRVEMYDDGRYFCMTGIIQNQLGRLTIESRDLAGLHKRMIAKEFVTKTEKSSKIKGDESAEDFRLIGEIYKTHNTSNPAALEEAFKLTYRDRYESRNKIKGQRNGKTYIGYTIQNFLAREKEDDAYVPRVPVTETANAERLVEKYSAEIRYCSDRKVWCVWDGSVWNVNDTGGISRRMQEVGLSIYDEASKTKNEKLRKTLASWAMTSESRRSQENSAALARYMNGIEVREFAETFDTHPMLLNVKNGTVDLRTGKLSKHNRDNFITKIVPIDYDENAECNEFLTFLGEALPDEGLSTYLFKVTGYCLSGLTSEQKWWMFHGVTASGKSTLVNILHGLLGPYAMALPENYFLITNNVKDYATANLAGVRLATCVETNEGRRLDTAKVKALTGGDIISAELKYQNCFTFRPQMKLILATNNRPHASASDDATWRRLMPIPFTKSVEEKNRVADLSAALLEKEAPGILRWGVMGCRTWLEQKLSEPDCVKVARIEYRTNEDNIQNFIDDCCVLEDEVERKELYAAYANWCKTNRQWQISAIAFGQDLRRLKVVLDTLGRAGERKWVGIRLRMLTDPHSQSRLN